MKRSRLESWPVLAAGAAIASLSLLARKMRPGRPGPQTNASDAVDDIELHPRATHEEVLDAGVKETFPASDPVAVGKAQNAYEQRREGSPPAQPEMPAPRSPDWMLPR